MRNRAEREQEARSLLDWYDRARRSMPWRAAAGQAPDPYHVWLSEIMLQQTTVATVGPYFQRFIARWPTLGALAAAELDEVLHAWQGLGYYSRARNLHRCARILVDEHGGTFPDDEKALLRLPGIGAYTAAAISAIAFDRDVVPVDGNVERVTARLYGIDRLLPGAKPEIAERARALAAGLRPSDFAQALMDLGATVCTPRRPSCGRCPWSANCIANAEGTAEAIPRKAPKAERPVRRGVAFWAVRGDGAVLLRRREEKGLLGGMMEFPSTEWRTGTWSSGEALKHAPIAADWSTLPGIVRHTFTHFHLELEVMATTGCNGEAPGVWCTVDRLGEHALPTVMKKIARHVIAQVG